MTNLCPACGQILPVKGERSCARCQKKIGRHDKWHAVGSMILHRDCKDPTLSGKPASKQGTLLEVAS